LRVATGCQRRAPPFREYIGATVPAPLTARVRISDGWHGLSALVVDDVAVDVAEGDTRVGLPAAFHRVFVAPEERRRRSSMSEFEPSELHSPELNHREPEALDDRAGEPQHEQERIDSNPWT